MVPRNSIVLNNTKGRLRAEMCEKIRDLGVTILRTYCRTHYHI